MNGGLTKFSNLFAVSLEPTPEDVFDGKVLHTMAARELIRDLEEGRSFMHSKGRPSEAEVSHEIVRLGVKYALTSTKTSYVAVQQSPKVCLCTRACVCVCVCVCVA